MAQTPEQPSLMTIAPELRNAICEFYLLNEVKEVQLARSGAIANHPGLLKVCQQLRREMLPMFQDMALKLTSRIVATVHNFDFKHVMIFLDSLDVLDADHRAAVQLHMVLRLDLGEEQDTDVIAAVRGLFAWREHSIKKPDGIPESKFPGYDKICETFLCLALRSFFGTLRTYHPSTVGDRRNKSSVLIRGVWTKWEEFRYAPWVARYGWY
ncbi:hypothetical protein LTR17_010849 [Elasticomyces elasticus]|nr:hypothetical protein LTR17_010849 [Elasticomyces elasticus]